MNRTEIEHNSLTGRWEGSLEFQSRKTNMAVDFSANTISIPQQGLQNYPIEEISWEAPEISFKVALAGTVLFTGQRVGRAIQGIFQQSGAQGTFQLTYAGESPLLSAASTGEGSSDSPEAAPTIEREEVSLETGTGVLYGTLTLPDRAGPVPLVLIIAGSGKPIYETLLDQLKTQMPGVVEQADQIINALRTGKRIEQVSPKLQSLFRPSIQPFLISMFRYDPAAEIIRLGAPVLIINGSRDLQTDMSQAKRLTAAKPEASLCIIDGMNHVLKDAPSDQEGNLATYSHPKLPLADGLLECIGSFLEKNLQ